MNKSALKSFATWSRRKLIEQVKTKAYVYGIDESNGLQMEERFGELVINETKYRLEQKAAFKSLQKQLEQKGYKQLMEEVAYTWFNRIIAIRYMEVHEFLPEKVNVLSSTVGRVDPDILFEFDTMDVQVDEAKVREHLHTGNTEAAYRLLFVAQCNALNSILPFMFEPIQDYTELLLPDFLLDAESVIKTLVQKEELTESFEEIEVIGWLYQYYIAEEKDRVFAQKSKYKKEEIPFATQLFTPKWIVQYMVQNSLGRYWTEAHREDEDLIDNWEYFIKHEEEDFHEKIAPYVNKELKVEDIKLLDPAMGSGHILVYAFEVFYEIYEKCGYPERDIPRLILENNLYGLDIDDRAYQLAAFALVMKAASYSKRFLRSVEREGLTLHVASIQETNHVSDDVIAYIAQQEKGDSYDEVNAFFDQYYNAKTYGSLINITQRDTTFFEQRLTHIANNPVDDLFYGEQHDIAAQVLPALLHQTDIMRNEYDVVVMNPPYMGAGSMPQKLLDFLDLNYNRSRLDLFTAFMEQQHFYKESTLIGIINQHSWMFLESFRVLREHLVRNITLCNMIHLGTKAFEEIKGEIVQSVAFIYRNSFIPNYNGIYFDITETEGSEEKKEKFIEFLTSNENFKFNQINITEINDCPWAYWLNKETLQLFKNPSIAEFSLSKAGIVTGKDPLFIRKWYEVKKEEIIFKESRPFGKYHLLNKGGSHRRFYGNTEHVIKLKDLWDPEKYNKSIRRGDEEYYFQRAISWSYVSNKYRAFREINDSVCGTASPAIYIKDDSLFYYILAFLNSKVAYSLIKVFNQTMNLLTSDINNLPLIVSNNKETIDLISQQCYELMRLDWSNKEEHWEFKEVSHFNNSLKEYVDGLLTESSNLRVNYLAKLESINQYFIDLYKIENLSSQPFEVDTQKVGFYSKEEIVKRILSYFVGLVFGRFNNTKFNLNHVAISLTEKPYFKKDLLEYLKQFLKSIYGEESVEENLNYIASVLSKKNSNNPEMVIRNYFFNEFYSDHLKMYENLPLYWLVDSGKQKGLRTLIYMHGYTPSTMAAIRFEHLQEMQAKYQQEIADLDNRLVNPNLSAADKKKLNAEKVSFEKKIDELREFDKRLAKIAAEEIEIDLDDGVKVNYEKFYRGGKGVLAKIK
ncbi:hypothetical protein A6K76_08200 [Caryophanon latum]|uniref:site-specific DNA-methyltransferase (adenine-specific) n=2 Tax=Caryophanon latum TaxID=33977 RepID=A0A1C0YWZ8_9BACL|nr:hypothetical protein A6K76_08200 [Caryophanon latum]